MVRNVGPPLLVRNSLAVEGLDPPQKAPGPHLRSGPIGRDSRGIGAAHHRKGLGFKA